MFITLVVIDCSIIVNKFYTKHHVSNTSYKETYWCIIWKFQPHYQHHQKLKHGQFHQIKRSHKLHSCQTIVLKYFYQDRLLRNHVPFQVFSAVLSNSLEQSVEAEVERYLNGDQQENKILNEYPYIREVYLRHNTTLCSSAAIERVFSQSALIFTPRRNRIHSTNFEYALLLKLNKKLFL